MDKFFENIGTVVQSLKVLLIGFLEDLKHREHQLGDMLVLVVVDPTHAEQALLHVCANLADFNVDRIHLKSFVLFQN